MTSSRRSRSASEVPSPSLLFELPFGALLAYSPRGTSELSKQSRGLCYQIKLDGVIGDPPVRAIERAVARLSDEGSSALREFIAQGEILVPCPPNAPFPPKQKPALWVPRRICEVLGNAGYGSAILPCLERVEAVPKSAFAAPGERPSPSRHMKSMRVTKTLEAPERITLVDDVVTKGATLLAAASLLADAYPDAEIRAFALVRTTGLTPNVERIIDPVVGKIRRTPSGADRDP